MKTTKIDLIKSVNGIYVPTKIYKLKGFAEFVFPQILSSYVQIKNDI